METVIEWPEVAGRMQGLNRATCRRDLSLVLAHLPTWTGQRLRYQSLSEARSLELALRLWQVAQLKQGLVLVMMFTMPMMMSDPSTC